VIQTAYVLLELSLKLSVSLLPLIVCTTAHRSEGQIYLLLSRDALCRPIVTSMELGKGYGLDLSGSG
jgi:hypothetical protein